MAINRAEKVALDQVCAIASGSGSLRKVTDAIDNAIADVSAILNRGDTVFPDEFVENTKASLKRMQEYKDTYVEKAKELVECNARLSDSLAQSAKNAGAVQADTKSVSTAAQNAASEIKGGTR